MCSKNVEMAGAKEKEFEVPIIKSAIIKSETRVWRGDILLVPEISNNILGKDFQIP